MEGESKNVQLHPLSLRRASLPKHFSIGCKNQEKSTTPSPRHPLPPAVSLPRRGGLIPLSDASVCNSKLTREERKQTSPCRGKPAKHIVHDRFSSCALQSPQRTRRCEPRATHAWLILRCRGQWCKTFWGNYTAAKYSGCSVYTCLCVFTKNTLYMYVYMQINRLLYLNTHPFCKPPHAQCTVSPDWLMKMIVDVALPPRGAFGHVF